MVDVFVPHKDYSKWLEIFLENSDLWNNLPNITKFRILIITF